MCMQVKAWARHQGINDATTGTFNSFALTLMALLHLQCTSPHVMPALALLLPEDLLASGSGCSRSGGGGGGLPAQPSPHSLSALPVDAAERLAAAAEECAATCTSLRGFGRDNTGRAVELFAGFVVRYMVVSRAWRGASGAGLAACAYQGTMVPTPFDREFAALVPDPFDSTDNAARSLGRHSDGAELRRVCGAFERTAKRLESLADPVTVHAFVEVAFGPALAAAVQQEGTSGVVNGRQKSRREPGKPKKPGKGGVRRQRRGSAPGQRPAPRGPSRDGGRDGGRKHGKGGQSAGAGQGGERAGAARSVAIRGCGLGCAADLASGAGRQQGPAGVVLGVHCCGSAPLLLAPGGRAGVRSVACCAVLAEGGQVVSSAAGAAAAVCRAEGGSGSGGATVGAVVWVDEQASPLCGHRDAGAQLVALCASDESPGRVCASVRGGGSVGGGVGRRGLMQSGYWARAGAHGDLSVVAAGGGHAASSCCHVHMPPRMPLGTPHKLSCYTVKPRMARAWVVLSHGRAPRMHACF